VRKGLVFNTTSMIDVIFILLVFFIAVSRLKEGKLALQLPEARGEAKVAKGDGREQLVVTLDRDNHLVVNRRSCATESEFAAAVRDHRGKHGAETPVVFVADRDSRSGALVGALKVVTDEGFRNISFTYEPRAGGR
jgi:biopolymer transport protein ExbD